MAEVLVGRKQDLLNGERVLVKLGATEVCVFAHDAEILAYDNQCAHQGGPAAEGMILGRVECLLSDDGRRIGDRFSDEEFRLICPWHGWEYDLRSGRSATDPRLGLRKYRANVRGDEVYLEVPDE